MLFFVVLVILSATSDGCELPDELTGHWHPSVPGWKELTISNTTISPITPKGTPLPFTCFLSNGTTYVLRTPVQYLSASLKYHYYICLEIVPSDTSPYLVFIRIRTAKNPYANEGTFQSILIGEDITLEGVCDVNSTELPLDFDYLLMKDYEQVMGNETCPSILQAEFSVNFTNETEYRKCPQGFELDGCDLSHLLFNYTGCGGEEQGDGASGSVNYTCLTSVENGDVLYTVILLEDAGTQQTPYEFACLAEKKNDDDHVMITKSAGTCGGTPYVTMEAEETVSCRSEAPTSVAPTTPAGSENTTQASTPSTQGTGTGGVEDGGGGCGAVSWGSLSFLLPFFASVLAAIKM